MAVCLPHQKPEPRYIPNGGVGIGSNMKNYFRNAENVSFDGDACNNMIEFIQYMSFYILMKPTECISRVYTQTLQLKSQSILIKLQKPHIDP